MNWNALAAIGQLVAAIGVIASLIFVGIQVRQSVRASKATAFQGLVSTIVQTNLVSIEEPQFLEIVDRARRGETLDPAEHRQYVLFVLAGVRMAQSAHYQMQLGLLDESKLESVVYNLVRHLKTRAGTLVWAEMAPRSEPQFREYIDSLANRLDSFETLLTPGATKQESTP
jgi:hypothetical protein